MRATRSRDHGSGVDKWLLLLSHRPLLAHPSRRIALVRKILVTVGKLFITAGIAHRRPPYAIPLGSYIAVVATRC